jgi:hypothetical protein
MNKKLLLGTTVLVAAGIATTGVAQAEEPIQAGISGYFRTAMGLIDQDAGDGNFADGAQSHTLGTDIEITVSGSTTLDNGITAGFGANIEGNGAAAGSAALDERHIYFTGGMGDIKIGQIESARQSLTQFSASGNYNFGINSPFFIFSNPGNSAGFFNVRTYDDGIGDEDNLKLVYFTPTFNGFRLGVSYSPDDGTNGQYGGNGGDAASGLQNNSSIGAEYSNSFGDFGLRLMAAMEQYTLERCNASAATQTCENTPTSEQLGAQITFGSFALGGGMLTTEQITATTAGAGREREDWDLGFSYWSGSIGVGAGVGVAELDQTDGSTDTLELVEVNATYVLGPGIDVGMSVRQGEFNDASGAPSTSDNDFTVMGFCEGLSL